MGIGENIKLFRLDRGMTQEQLAEKAGISRVALGNYERRERIPSLEILDKISAALDTSSKAIITYNLFDFCDIYDLKVNHRVTISLSNEQINTIKKNINKYAETTEFKDYCTRSIFYVLLDKYKEALNDYTKAIEINPNNSTLYLMRGNLYSFLDLKKDAFKDYNTVIKNIYGLNCKLEYDEKIFSKGYDMTDIKSIFEDMRRTQKQYTCVSNIKLSPLANKINLLNDDCIDLISNLVDKLIQDKNNLR
ncbi:TPA: helix-turn-helix domain-containing protein [Clostridioides difficile]